MSDALEYQQDGTLLRANFANDQLNGETRIEENGRLLAVLRYQQGVLNGMMERWHPNGQLAMQQAYREGRPDGIARYFSENGELLREEQWLNGLLHGECRSFYPSGQVQLRE